MSGSAQIMMNGINGWRLDSMMKAYTNPSRSLHRFSRFLHEVGTSSTPLSLPVRAVVSSTISTFHTTRSASWCFRRHGLALSQGRLVARASCRCGRPRQQPLVGASLSSSSSKHLAVSLPTSSSPNMNPPRCDEDDIGKDVSKTQSHRLNKHHQLRRLTAYLDLGKAKLSALVVSTTAAGFVAAGGPLSTQLDTLAACLLGTALCSSSAAAWNQILEQDADRRMKRTQQRPLVSGALRQSEAITVATVWGASGVALLAAGTDPVTTALGAGNVAIYAGLYTYLKRISIYNTWVGAVVGAIPPVMGWTAATGGSLLDTPALLLGGTLYLWQIPHFFALSYMHRMDYKRGGFEMLPVVEERENLEAHGQGVHHHPRTAAVIVRYTWYLSAVPFVATYTNVTSSMFALEGIALNAYALFVAHRFSREQTNGNARKVFLTSLWYLPSLLMLFVLHSKVWDEEKENHDFLSRLVSNQIKSLREAGRSICLHEAAAAKTTRGDQACPVTVVKRDSIKQIDHAQSAIAMNATSLVTSMQDRTDKGV